MDESRSLTLPEDILLLLLDEQRGDWASHLPESVLHTVLAGAVLIELSLKDRIDTDLQHLMSVDDTPLGDNLLDSVLAQVAKEEVKHDTVFWIERVATHGDAIRRRAVERLVRRGILEGDSGGGEEGLLSFLALAALFVMGVALGGTVGRSPAYAQSTEETCEQDECDPAPWWKFWADDECVMNPGYLTGCDMVGDDQCKTYACGQVLPPGGGHDDDEE